MTHYELLGVSPAATVEEIQHAYQMKSMDVSAEERKELQESYTILSDPTSREIYDDYLIKLDMLRVEARYAHFAEKQEEYQLNDGTLLSKWTKLYRLDWRTFKTLSRSDKLAKVWSEFLFHTFYGLVGIFCAILFLMYAGNVHFFMMVFSPDAFWIRVILYATFCGFFVASKAYGNIYRQWKISRRST